MQEAIARYPDDLPLRVGQVELYIRRKDAASAERWLSRMDGLENSAGAIPQLRVRIAAARGDKDQLRKLLEGLTPDLRGVLDAKQLQLVHSVAFLAESVDDHEYALKLVTEFARRVPSKENQMDLAHFTAMYGDIDQGLEMLQKLFPDNMDRVLSSGIEMLRSRRREAPEKIEAAVDAWVKQARRDDPESARRMMQEAESFEVEEKYPQAIAAYGEILKRDDVPKVVRATVHNNLCFLLAMTRQDLDQALEGVNEAMTILGPISDILDTRGLVYVQRGEFKPAVDDLKLAVTMNATASKYFHLAQAQLGAGDNAGALDTWKQAEAMGIGPDKVPTVEQPVLQETTRKIEALRSQTAAA